MALINISNEYGRLRRILLYKPSIAELTHNNAAAVLYSSLPDPYKVIEEFKKIVTAFEDQGVEVIILDGSTSTTPTPNMLFLRDVFFVISDRLYVGKAKHSIRRAEQEKAIRLLKSQHPNLAELAINIPTGTLEGADILIEDTTSGLAYTGSRTSEDAVAFIEKENPQFSCKRVPANINSIPQHLLGGIHIIDKKILTRRTRYCPQTINNYTEILFEESNEVTDRFSLNIVTLGPKRILMPYGCNETRQILEQKGVECIEVGINEIHKMGGGLACMTVPILRT